MRKNENISNFRVLFPETLQIRMRLLVKLYGLDKNKQNDSWEIKDQGSFFGVRKCQYYTFVIGVSLEKVL